VFVFGWSDLDGFGGEHGAVGLSDRQMPVGGEFESPSQLVHHVMMPTAQWDQILEVGRASEFPGDDVVDLTPIERHVTAAEAAGAVHRP